jgi:hypothetical protein
LEKLITERNQVQDQQVKRDAILDEEITSVLPFKKLHFSKMATSSAWFQMSLLVKNDFEPDAPVAGNLYRAGKRLDAFLRFDIRIESHEHHVLDVPIQQIVDNSDGLN